jgi:hypothetical protein
LVYSEFLFRLVYSELVFFRALLFFIVWFIQSFVICKAWFIQSFVYSEFCYLQSLVYSELCLFRALLFAEFGILSFVYLEFGFKQVPLCIIVFITIITKPMFSTSN